MNRRGDLDLLDAQPEDSASISCLISFTSGFGRKETLKRRFDVTIFAPALQGFFVSFYLAHGRGGGGGGRGGGGCDEGTAEKRKEWVKELVCIESSTLTKELTAST